MKILMTLEHNYPPDIRVEKEIKTLIAEGYEVTLACVTHHDEPESEKQDGLIIYRRKIPSFIYKSSVGALKFPFYFNYWRSYLNSLLEREKYDVLHVHDLPLAKIACEIRSQYHIPFVLDLHENYPSMLKVSPHTQTLLGRILSSHKQWLKYEKKMIKEADIILSVVEEQRDRLVSIGTNPHKHYLVRNTPFIEDIPTTSRMDDFGKCIFVYAGTFGAAREFNILFPAFKELVKEESSACLWLVGNGKNTPRLVQYVKNLSMAEHIVFHGWQSHSKMMDLISQSDFTLLPLQRTENYDNSGPNKLFQYMMLGKPVIASNCAAIERILNECQAGITYKEGDVSDLRSKMLYAIRNRSKMNELGKNGRRAVLGKYNWQPSGENLLKAYKSLT